MLKPCARSTRNDSRSKRYPVSLPIPAARADGLRPRPSRTAARNRSPAAESNRTYIAEPPSQKALRRSIEPGVRQLQRRRGPDSLGGYGAPFEADFEPCSYGFRPNRRAHDAVAETRFLASKSYEWVLEGDITACFDEISHSALMDRVRARVADKRVLALVKAFLKAGILTERGTAQDSITGTPQGGILTPPTQLAIRPYFDLRVGFGAVVGPAAHVVPHRGGGAG